MQTIVVAMLQQQQQQQQQQQHHQQQQQHKQIACSMALNVKNTTGVAIKTGVGVLQRTLTAQKVYAKALYDNFAESPDELAFKKGDILTVIEQDTAGLTGWWLCAFRGRQGLCPGNRLRLVNSYDSGCFSISPASSQCPSLAASTATLNSSFSSAEIYENASIVSGTGSVCSGGGGGSSGSGKISASETQLNQQHPIQQLQQRHGTRRSWHVSPDKVITPQRQGDVYVYDIPPAHSQQQIYSNQSIYQNFGIMSTPNSSSNNSITNSNHEFQTYDIPKPATAINYDCPKNVLRSANPSSASAQQHHIRFDTIRSSTTPIQEESYDIPRPLAGISHQQQNTLTPSSSNSSLLTSDSLSLSFSSSNRSSLAIMPDYDIPRRNPLPVRAVHQAAAAAAAANTATTASASSAAIQNQSIKSQSHTVNGSCMTYDFPLANTTQSMHEDTQLNASAALNSTTKELPLELNSALETLAKLQSEITAAITRTLSFVAPNWRLREKLEPVIMEVKLAAVRLRSALHDLTEFSEGALGNATRSEDRTLALKLRPLVRALRDANKLIQNSAENLEANGGWTLENLSRSEDKATCKPDSLDQLIACAQTLTEDVRQSTSFIQGNAPLLFKRHLDVIDSASQEVCTATTPTVNTKANRESTNTEWLEDDDYVSFESKDAAAKKNIALREAIPATMKNKFDNVIRAAETTAMATSQPLPLAAAHSKQQELSNNDKQVVRFYAKQISLYMGDLGQAIDSFLETVEKNQPPKYFIAYGKFVVVSAHNLVAIGDNVHRNVSKTELREKILRCTDALSDALRTCVNKSKKAAAHFPSVIAVQEMVDSVVDISHLASDLKEAMLQAVQLTI